VSKINSRSKGCEGEREASKKISEVLGVPARRGQQFTGHPDAPDIVVDLPGLHFEVKRTEKLSLYKAMDKAVEDAGPKVPIVMHRRSRSDWLVVLKADDMMDVACLLYRFGGLKEWRNAMYNLSRRDSCDIPSDAW